MKQAPEEIQWIWERIKDIIAIILSPFAEKNPVKIWSYRAPVVLSAERIIAMGAFGAWLKIAFDHPELLNGWPLSTFGVFIVLALPITRALSRAPVAATIDFAKTLVGRFGRGAAARVLHTTSANSTAGAVEQYDDEIDGLWQESDPSGLGHYDIDQTIRTEPIAEDIPVVAKAPESPSKTQEPVSAPVTRETVDRKPDEAPAPVKEPEVKVAKKEPAKTPGTSLPLDQPKASDPEYLKWAFGERDVIEDTSPGGSNKRIEWYFTHTAYGKAIDDVPWCSAGLCAAVETTGGKSTRDARARSWINWGRKGTGKRGDIAVLKRGANPAQGHVGIVLARTATHVYLWGGNQGNRWQVQRYDIARVTDYRQA